MLLACPNCATTYDLKASVIGENGRSLRCARCHNVWFATRAQELIAAPAMPAAPADASKVAPAGPDVPGISLPSVPPRTPAFSTPLPLESSTPDIDSPPLAPAVAHGDRLTPHSLATNVQGEDIESFARRRAREAAQRRRAIREQFGAPALIAILGVVVAAMLAWRENIVRHAPQMGSFYASIGLPVNLRQLAINGVSSTKEVRDGVPGILVEGTISSISKFSVEVPRLRFGLRNAAGQEIFSWTAEPDKTVLAPGEVLPFRSRLASPPAEGNDVVVRFFNKRDAIEGAR
jgi:predicted Zn finger-like uncharacterized protein